MKQYDDEFEERWINLVKYDERIQSAIAQLQPYGDAAIDELKQAFHAIDDFTQLPNITKQIVQENLAQKAIKEAEQMVAELVAEEISAEKSKIQEKSINEAEEEEKHQNHQQLLDTKVTQKKNLYQILGVQENSPKTSIDDAYAELLNKFQALGHEDTSVELFSIRNAHDVLSNPQKRASYDEKLGAKFEAKLAEKQNNMPLHSIQIGELTVHEGNYGSYDFYEILGIPRNATREDIEAAHKAQLEKYNDHNVAGQNSTNQIKIIDSIYSILSNANSNSVYNKRLQPFRNQVAAKPGANPIVAKNALHNPTRNYHYVSDLSPSFLENFEEIWQEHRGKIVGGAILILLTLAIVIFAHHRDVQAIAARNAAAQAKYEEEKRLEFERQAPERALKAEEDQAQKAVLAVLKDPGSAKFGRLIRIDEFTACLSVNSRNSFGGYTGMQWIRMKKAVEKEKIVWVVDRADEFGNNLCRLNIMSNQLRGP